MVFFILFFLELLSSILALLSSLLSLLSILLALRFSFLALLSSMSILDSRQQLPKRRLCWAVLCTVSTCHNTGGQDPTTRFPTLPLSSSFAPVFQETIQRPENLYQKDVFLSYYFVLEQNRTGPASCLNLPHLQCYRLQCNVTMQCLHPKCSILKSHRDEATHLDRPLLPCPLKDDPNLEDGTTSYQERLHTPSQQLPPRVLSPC